MNLWFSVRRVGVEVLPKHGAPLEGLSFVDSKHSPPLVVVLSRLSLFRPDGEVFGRIDPT